MDSLRLFSLQMVVKQTLFGLSKGVLGATIIRYVSPGNNSCPETQNPSCLFSVVFLQLNLMELELNFLGCPTACHVLTWSQGGYELFMVLSCSFLALLCLNITISIHIEFPRMMYTYIYMIIYYIYIIYFWRR